MYFLFLDKQDISKHVLKEIDRKPMNEKAMEK